MNAILALEDGTWYQGVAAGAPGEASGEVVFNTSMTGYQEVLDRPLLCRADRDHDLAADWQLRRRRHRRRVRPAASGWLHRARPVADGQQLAGAGHAEGLPSRQRDRRHRRHRHARAHQKAPVGRGDARRHRHWTAGSAGAGREGPVGAADGRRRPGEGRHLRGRLRLQSVPRRHGGAGQLWRRARAPRLARAPGRRLRLRHQDQHPAPPRCAQLRRAGVPGVGAGRRRPGLEARRRVPQQRSRRPGRSELRHRQRQADRRRRRAALRHLPRPSAAGAGPRRRDLQAQVRSSWRQPPGQAARVGPGRDHLAEPRLRGRSRVDPARASR